MASVNSSVEVFPWDYVAVSLGAGKNKKFLRFLWQKEWQIDVWQFWTFDSCPKDKAAGEEVVAWTQTWRAVAPDCTKMEMTAI